MGFLERVTTSLLWRSRLWAWGDRLRVGSKYLRRDPTLVSPYTAKMIALDRYEKPERDLLAHMHEHGLIGRGDRVIEAGGGLGAITMEIADIVGADAVFTFEPNPRTAQALRDNLALNGYLVAVENAALVADDRSEVEFADTIEGVGFMSARLDDATITEPAQFITVQAEPLARAMARLDPTVLIFDVEGAEADLLRSVTNWGRVRAIHLELHPEMLAPERLEEMFAHLRQAGFLRQSIPADFGDRVALLVKRLP